jgi:hypothetical protein
MNLPIYAMVGNRPVKAVQTPDGGLDVLAWDWQGRTFVRDMNYLERLVMGDDADTDIVDQATFEARVQELLAGR